MAPPEPFKLNVSDADLELLKKKLELARLPDQPTGYTIEQGVPVPQIEPLIEYWRSSYLPNWRKHEAKLNELPMFTTTVATENFGDLNIHFVHQRSSIKEAIPLLFVHGWPGSFIEVVKLLPLLKKGSPDYPAFHVVAPSLPNYGFSDGVSKRGFNLRHYGEVCHKLMLSLGYDSYVAQGGDWGSMIVRIMGRSYPQSLRAVHVNLVAFSWFNLLTSPMRLLELLVTPWSKQERQGLMNGWEYTTKGNSYYLMHQTRPQTVAYCLSDSPVALLGWVYEKLIHWTDNYPWTQDEILTWISIYWFSKAGPGASVRTYFEAENIDPSVGMKKDKNFWDWMPVPLGISQFPKDIVGVPKVFARTLGNVVFESWSESGGHFASTEKPEILAGDLRKMFARGGPAYGAVEDSDGYIYDGSKKSV